MTRFWKRAGIKEDKGTSFLPIYYSRSVIFVFFHKDPSRDLYLRAFLEIAGDFFFIKTLLEHVLIVIN